MIVSEVYSRELRNRTQDDVAISAGHRFKSQLPSIRTFTREYLALSLSLSLANQLTGSLSNLDQYCGEASSSGEAATKRNKATYI